MFEAITLALALAMDATAVSAARAVSGISVATALRMATAFALFQAGMAAIGWAAGAAAARWIERWDHWVAFGLLALIGGRMIYTGLRAGDDVAAPASTLGWSELLVLAVATSIDALVAGITLPLLAIREEISLVLIGAVTFVLSLAGARAGHVLGARLGRRLEVLGGLALVAIGVKIVLDHIR
jgi:putative Mn2+ efflux pump MntP